MELVDDRVADRAASATGAQTFQTQPVTSCSVCARALPSHSGIVAQSYWGDQQEFRILVCENCGLGLTDPRPTSSSIPLMYDTKADEVSGLGGRDFDADQSKLFGKLKDFIAKRQITRRFDVSKLALAVDYGAGNGRFANALRSAGARHVTAVDYTPERPRELSAQVEYVTVDDFIGSPARADLIFLRHVLEHAEEPVGLLSQLAAQLAGGGQLFIEVPHFDSALRRVIGKDWVGYYVPQHLQHFTRKSLALTLEKAGLRGTIEGGELPIMGNQLAVFLGAQHYTLPYKLAGVLLHPLQLIIEKAGRSSGVLTVVATRAD